MNPTSAIPLQQPTSGMPAGGATPAPAASSDPSQFGDYSEWAQEEMAKGFTADQLQQTLAQNKIAVAPTASAAATTPADNEPWWSKILPTAGGILGGLAGGAADVASLGMLAPLINPITGAAAGGAVGQAGENLVKGENPFQENDLTSGLENGVGQLIGGGASKVVGMLGKGITSAATKATEGAAAKEAADATAKHAIDDATATKLNFGGIHADTQNALELGKQQQFVKSMGFDATNPHDMQKVAEGGSLLNNAYDRALTQAKPIETADINKSLFTPGAPSQGLTAAETAALEKQGINPSAIANAKVSGGTNPLEGPSMPTFEANSPTAAALKDFSKKTGVDLANGLPENMPATQMRQLQQAVGRQIGNVQATVNSAKLNGLYNGEMTNELSKLNELYSKLGEKIKTPEVNNAIANMTVPDADRQGLIATYGDKLGNHLADTVGNAKSADELLGPMQQFTKMGNASDMAIKDIENVTGSPRAEARTKFAINGGVVTPGAVGGSNPTLDAITTAAGATGHPAGAIINVASKIHKAGLTPKIAGMMGNTLTRTAPMITPATMVASNIPNMAAEGTSNSAIPTLPAGGTGEQSMQQQPENPMNALYAQLLAQEQAAPTVLGPSLSGPLSTMAPSVQQNQFAANSMSALPSTYENAGGAQGMGGGLLSKLTGMIPGTAANTYQMQQQAAAAQLAKVLGISPEAAMAMLPSLMQSPQTAAPQQQATGGILSQLTSGLPAQ
jgi:hypothetical protein